MENEEKFTLQDKAKMFLLTVLTAIICWQGWLIRDLREENAEQARQIKQLEVNQQRLADTEMSIIKYIYTGDES